jgi:glucosyl-dolichyl phosphate glucuronosyltransferase
VSIIISSYTTERYTDVAECISSLESQTLRPTEIILVLDPIQDLLDFYVSRMSKEVKIVTSKNPGLSNARNAGIENASGDILAFIDDDAVADKMWLQNIIRNYEDSSVIGVGGYVKACWEGGRPLWFPEELDWIVGCTYKGFSTEKSQIRNPIGCNMSFKSSVFRKAGYFRSDVGRTGKNTLGDEETEMSIRATDKIPGSKIMYDPSAVVYHKVGTNRKSLAYVWKRSFSEGISKATIVRSFQKSRKLAHEETFLRYLISTAIPSRLREIYRYEKMAQLLVILFSAIAVLAGYGSRKIGSL